VAPPEGAAPFEVQSGPGAAAVFAAAFQSAGYASDFARLVVALTAGLVVAPTAGPVVGDVAQLADFGCFRRSAARSSADFAVAAVVAGAAVAGAAVAGAAVVGLALCFADPAAAEIPCYSDGHPRELK
jgi:hypothetical protein